MSFNENLPEWYAPGTEPPASKKTTGWDPGDKPPAGYFNWLFNKTYLALKELQQKAFSDKTNITIDPNTTVPYGNTGTIGQFLAWIAKVLKSHSGKLNWWDPPTQNMEQMNTTLKGHVGVGGSAHPLATTTVAGFMSGPDKKKLDEQVVVNTGGVFTGDVTINAGLTTRLRITKRFKDSNGKYTTVEYRRKKDGTLFMNSVLSNPDSSGNYRTDTWSIYNAAGTTVVETVTWTVAYDADGDVTSVS